MIEGARWRALGILQYPADPVRRRAAVSVLLDDRHELPARQRAVPSVERAELHAVLDAPPDPGSHPRPADRDAVQHVDAEHDDDRDHVDGDLADLRPARRLCAVAAEVPVRRQHRHRDLHHLSRAADAAVHSARRHHPQLQARRHALGVDPDLSDLPDPVLHLADDGLLQVDPEGAGGMRPHRRRAALEGDDLHHLPDRGARASCRPGSSPSRCRGTSSSMRWCSCPRPSRRPCRSASPRNWCAATCSTGAS